MGQAALPGGSVWLRVLRAHGLGRRLMTGIADTELFLLLLLGDVLGYMAAAIEKSRDWV